MGFIRKTALSIAIALFLLSCGNKIKDVPEYVVEKEKLVPLLVDIHLIDAMLTKEQKPHQEKYEEAINMYPSVLLKHGIDRAVFDSTIRYYVKFPAEFALIYDDVLRELSIKEGEVQPVPGEIEEEELE